MNRDALRTLAYRSGALGLRHWWRHRQTLTVAMFHRVTLPGSPGAANADPTYALPQDLFAQALEFFRRHYAVVGLQQVLASRAGGPALPPGALLLTFDDGWQDFATAALPALGRAALAATVFAATDALDDPAGDWWQDTLLRALRHGARAAGVWQAAGPHGAIPQETPELALLLRYAALSPEARARALAPLAASGEGRQMLRRGQLAAPGVSIGGHGAAHLPLSMLADPVPDLARCRAALGPAVTALSFPHGRYNAGCIAAAHAAGFTTLFTSDACLNAAPGGRPSGLLGRISIEAAAITDARGGFDPARLAAWLMHRPVARL